ncbi:MAG: cytochrome c [Alphaproteobacteria bacterium]|nr:cytochrome c [Alphaproteobacteria bacterium]
MRMWIGKVALGFALTGLLAGAPAMVALAQADAIKERKDNRQEMRKAMGAIKAVIDAKGDAKTVVPLAERLVNLEKAFSGHFPAGSDKGETKALPAVWSDWNGFLAASKNTQEAATKLAQVAAAGDLAGVGQQFGAVGGTCGACHDKYRAK